MEIIIQVNDYLAFQPNAANKYTSTEIQSAINLSYTLLDAECAGAITERWPKTSTEKGYLTASQKEHIKNAFKIETQYVLMNDLDFSQGSDQMSFGSFNMSSNRPNRNLISPQALKELQLAGVWYQADFVQARQDTPKRFSLAEDMSRPLWIDEPLPQSVSDNRYVHKIAEIDGSKGKFLKYDEQGMIEYVDLYDYISGGVWGAIVGNIEHQTDLMNYFARYFNKNEINTILNNYYKKNETYGIYDAAHKDTTTYNAQEIDNKISESSAIFRGTFTGGTTRPTSFDYDTYCKNQMTAEGITPTNNDYLFVHWTDIEEFDRCRYTQATDTWQFEYTVSQIAQKQSDWTEEDTTAVSYIKHKPTIPTEQHLYLHKLTIIHRNSGGDVVFTVNLPIYTAQETITNDTLFELVKNRHYTCFGYIGGSGTFSGFIFDVMSSDYSNEFLFEGYNTSTMSSGTLYNIPKNTLSFSYNTVQIF